MKSVQYMSIWQFLSQTFLNTLKTFLQSTPSLLGYSCEINKKSKVFIMDNKIKLFAVTSLVAVMATGCSGYRNGSSQSYGGGSNGNGNYGNANGGGSSQVSGSGQVAGSGQVSRGGLFGQRRPATCAPCAARAQPKTNYTYTPAPKRTYKPAPKRQAGKHNQQYYIDRWNRQQQQSRQGNTAAKTNTNYSGYGSGNYNANNQASNSTYYDYSSAGKKANNNANVSASNKSIYTGSYQQKTYKPYNPTTYSGGSSATTNTTSNTTYVGNSGGSTGGGSTYTVKKGDTVFEIMRQTGVYWKDIIRVNNLQAPAYNINPGQIIRLK